MIKVSIVLQPSWRHFPGSDNRTMLAYRGSDVKLSWNHDEPIKLGYKPCAYVKEGLGNVFEYRVFYRSEILISIRILY